MIRMRLALLALVLAAAGARAQTALGHVSGSASSNNAPSAEASTAAKGLLPDMLDGIGIYQQFRDGLADQGCQSTTSNDQLQQQFSHAPARLADRKDNILPLFGYVVEAVRDAGLPTEFALIPFVESGYHPGTGHGPGPTGLWQLISLTARNHGVRVRSGYDGRLSPVDSTQAAVRYLKTLHGMFGGNWQLAVMAYNAGENRVLQALRKSGASFGNAHPPQLPGLSSATYTYVQKLHALACSLEQAGQRNDWMAGLDRPVPRLQPLKLPSNFGSLASWAQREGHNPDQLAGLNPALSQLRNPSGHESMWVLAPAPEGAAAPITALDLIPSAEPASAGPDVSSHADNTHQVRASSHEVAKGDSASTIARRYRLSVSQLLQWNGLNSHSVIKPGMVLRLQAPKH